MVTIIFYSKSVQIGTGVYSYGYGLIVTTRIVG